jgi:hypothetical protein
MPPNHARHGPSSLKSHLGVGQHLRIGGILLLFSILCTDHPISKGEILPDPLLPLCYECVEFSFGHHRKEVM